MLKFTEQLEERKVNKIFTDIALQELRDLVKNDKENPIPLPEDRPTPIDKNLDITKPAPIKVVKLPTENKNLFSLPTVITVLFFVFSTIYIDYDAALEDGRISRRERLKLIYLLFGAVATLVSRGSEGSTKPYVPKWVPGPHLKDEDGDGDIDQDDQRIYNSRNL